MVPVETHAPLVGETTIAASSQTGQFFLPQHICAMWWNHAKFHVFLGEFLIYWDLKTEILNVSGRQQVYTSFPFLKWDLNMHPMTHVRFPTHFASLEHVVVVQIWIMDYIKCVENLVISNIYIYIQWPNEPWTVSNFSTTLLLFYVACRKQSSRLEEATIIVSPTRGHVSLPEPRGLRQAPVCKRLVI